MNEFAKIEIGYFFLVADTLIFPSQIAYLKFLTRKPHIKADFYQISSNLLVLLFPASTSDNLHDLDLRKQIPGHDTFLSFCLLSVVRRISIHLSLSLIVYFFFLSRVAIITQETKPLQKNNHTLTTTKKTSFPSPPNHKQPPQPQPQTWATNQANMLCQKKRKRNTNKWAYIFQTKRWICCGVISKQLQPNKGIPTTWIVNHSNKV